MLGRAKLSLLGLPSEFDKKRHYSANANILAGINFPLGDNSEPVA